MQLSPFCVTLHPGAGKVAEYERCTANELFHINKTYKCWLVSTASASLCNALSLTFETTQFDNPSRHPQHCKSSTVH